MAFSEICPENFDSYNGHGVNTEYGDHLEMAMTRALYLV